MKMKKISLFAALIFLINFAFSQTTYYWVGGNGPISFSSTSGSRWNTSLDGSGTLRSSAVASPLDILIMDGNNVGGSSPTTGTVTITDGSNDMGQLKIINHANVIYQRNSVGTGTISIKGDGTNNDDFYIDSTSTFTLNAQDISWGNVLQFETNVTGRIFGTLNIINGACRLSNLNFVQGGSIFFESGSVCNSFVDKTPTSSNYPFGKDVTAKNGIVFKNGSLLNYLGGYSIFTNTSGFSPILLSEGSTLRINTNIPSSYVTSSNFFSTRKLSNLIIATNNIVTAGSFYSLNDLTVEQGARLNLTSSYTPISGNLINNGIINTGAAASAMNRLLFLGNTTQTISGSGEFDSLGAIIVGSNANVVLNRDLKIMDVTTTSKVSGLLNTNDKSIYGTGKLYVISSTTGPSINVTAGGVAGSDTLRLDPSIYSGSANTGNVGSGNLVIGDSIAPNTYVIATSSSNSRITLSKPTIGVVNSITIISKTGTLATSNPYGIDSSIKVSSKSFEAGTNYVFNGSTSTPFTTSITEIGNLTINADVKSNKSINVSGNLKLESGKFTIHSTDSVRIKSNSAILGTFNNSNYIVTEVNGANIGKLRFDSINSEKTIPIGTPNHYLPVTISPNGLASITASVYDTIKTTAAINGIPFSDNQKKKFVDAVWNLNGNSGSSTSLIKFNWVPSIEGSIFTQLPNAGIGVIKYKESNWTNPLNTGDNVANTASVLDTSYGSFSIGSLPPANIFTFNAIPNKTYGDSDFTISATSLYNTNPIKFKSNNTQVATIDSVSGTIHIVGAGDANITASQLSDGLYNDTSITKSFHVDKKVLTITAENKRKYERDPNPILTFTYSGFVFGEDESVILNAPIISTTALLNSPNGDYPIYVSGGQAANYSMSYVDGVLTVNPKTDQVITLNSIASKIYGAANFSSNLTSSNSTIPITLTSSNINVATIVNESDIHITGAGQTTLTATQPGNNFYFPADTVRITFTVNKADLTIKAIDTFKYKGLANPIFEFDYAGFVYGEDASVLSTPASAFTTANNLSDTGNYTIVVSNATASNYNISFSNGNLKIKSRPGFIFTFPSIKNYGDADFDILLNSMNITQPISCTSNNSSIATVYSNDGGLTYKIHIQGTGSVAIHTQQLTDGTYDNIDTSITLTVNKAPLVITANDTFKYQGSINPIFTESYNGFVNGETNSVFNTPVIINTTATTNSPVGDYAISISNATALNYSISTVDGNLTIRPQFPQTISFDSLSDKTYGDTDFNINATSTNSTIPIVLTSSDTNVVSIINGNNIHIKGAGDAIITASQLGNTIYIPAADVTQPIHINKKGLRIIAKDTSKYEGLINPTFNASYVGFVNGEDSSFLLSPVLYTTPSTVDSDSGNYAINPIGATSNNYEITFLPGILKVKYNQFKFPLFSSKTYGNADFSTNVISINTTELINYSSSDTSIATISSTGIIHIVGAGVVNINANQASDGNNPAGNRTRVLTINKAALLIKADDKLKFEGDNNPAFTITITGFVLSDNQDSLQVLPDISSPAVTSSPIGNYPITLTGGFANNYNYILNNGIITILANQPQVITFNSIANKVYGNTDFNAGATSTNMANPIIYTSSNPSIASISGNSIHIVSAGTVTITASQPATTGYTAASDESRVLNINKANLTIKVIDTSKTQGTDNPLFDFNYTGFVLGETPIDLIVKPSAVTTANKNSTPGKYPVNAEGANSNNYNFTYLNGILKVYPNNNNPQTLTCFVNSSKNLTVNIYSEEFNLGELKLYTIFGQYITKKNLYVPAGFSTYELPLYNIVPGNYLLVFYEKDRILSKVISITK